VELLTVPIDKPGDLNVILGQSHFIEPRNVSVDG
jgi:adenosine/AMP kinase